MNTSDKVDGGIITKVISLSDVSPDQVAIIGVWSGGRWGGQNRFPVRQFRDGVFIADWQVASVQLIRQRDAILNLSLADQCDLPLEGDVLVFGDGSYTTLDIERTDLPIHSDSTVEVGSRHFHGVALTQQGVVRKVIFFHSAETTIEWESSPLIWWKGCPFYVAKVERGEEMSNAPMSLKYSRH